MASNDALQKIMAVNPGSRYLAIVVFDGAKLREWRLKSIQEDGAAKKLTKAKHILAAFIERYHPDILATKKLHPSRGSATLRLMAGGIVEYCRKQGMTVFSYSIHELKRALAGSIRMNKAGLIDILSSEYPELNCELKREQQSRNPYFVRLFEAVALGHVCFHQICNNH